MHQPSIKDRLRYAFDNTMSKGPIALIGWLGLVAIIVILVVSLLVWSMGIASEASLTEQIWAYLMDTLETDAMTDAPWSFRLVTLIVVFTGIFVMSTLIGVLTAGIEDKLEELRKGRSKVIETGHTVILGWSEQVFSIISELVIANENQPKSCIVILGEEDKVEMEDEIRDKVESTSRTRIVCRTGSPMEMTDLDIVSLHTAKSIIILAPKDDDPDASVIKTMLAITNNPDRRPEPYHIVAEMHNPRNMDVARIVGRDEAELLLVGEVIARVTAQTCRQSGLSVVYTEFLDFEGDEIYFQEELGLVGKTFGEALLNYEDSAVLGLRPKGKEPILNPPMDTVIQKGDEIIAVSEDDDTVILSGLTDLNIDESAIRTAQATETAVEHVLLLGWNWRAPTIIRELDHYVPPGSTVTVLADVNDAMTEINQLDAVLKNQNITCLQGDTTDRAVLDELDLAKIDHVILLAYSDKLEPQKADARTLITLLHLRDIAQRNGYTYSIVSEMMDIRNRKLAEITEVNDFVVSDRLISLMLSQISENKALSAVFADLFDPEGSETYLKPVTHYVEVGQPVNFYTIVEAARRQSQVAIGYRIEAHTTDASREYGLVVNPRKLDIITFAKNNKIIVLAED
ncbi:MAG: potassium transporter TrkA [Chloroflexi bacterium]|nr:potassium transporter TrkA [Chloroflexota bacterium]